VAGFLRSGRRWQLSSVAAISPHAGNIHCKRFSVWVWRAACNWRQIVSSLAKLLILFLPAKIDRTETGSIFV
jgi:hypothetical protein